MTEIHNTFKFDTFSNLIEYIIIVIKLTQNIFLYIFDQSALFYEYFRIAYEAEKEIDLSH